MEKFTNTEIEKLANLSALDLSSEEKLKMKKELKNILKFVDNIESLPTHNTNSTKLTLSKLRKDKTYKSVSQNQALFNAPNKENGFFVVPKVVD